MRIKRVKNHEKVTLLTGIRNEFVCCMCGLVHAFKVEIESADEISVEMWEDLAESDKEYQKVLKRMRRQRAVGKAKKGGFQ